MAATPTTPTTNKKCKTQCYMNLPLANNPDVDTPNTYCIISVMHTTKLLPEVPFPSDTEMKEVADDAREAMGSQ